MNFLKIMHKELLDQYMEAGHSVFYATLGPGDALVTPFEMIVVEQAKERVDNVGFRVSFWLNSDLEKMEAARRWLAERNKTNKYLESAIGVIALVGYVD